jgi:pentatricopeptide repeat protein
MPTFATAPKRHSSVRAYQLHKLVSNPELISDKDLVQLREIAQKYPYFQVVRALIASKTQSPADIQDAAMYTAELSALKAFVESQKQTPGETTFVISDDSEVFEKLTKDEVAENITAPTEEESLQSTGDEESSAPEEEPEVTHAASGEPQLQNTEEPLGTVEETALAKEEAVEEPEVSALSEEIQADTGDSEQEEEEKAGQEEVAAFAASDDTEPVTPPTHEAQGYKAPDRDRMADEEHGTSIGYASFEEEKSQQPEVSHSDPHNTFAPEPKEENSPSDNGVQLTYEEIKQKQAALLAGSSMESQKDTEAPSAEEESEPETPRESEPTPSTGFDDPDQFFSKFDDISPDKSKEGIEEIEKAYEEPKFEPEPFTPEPEPVFALDAALGFDLGPDKEEEPEPSAGQKEENLGEVIDRFVANPPNPPKVDATAPVTDLSTSSTSENPSLVTETLANIYVKQGNIDKAISLYDQLKLTNPEKSSYFAALIEKLKDSK